VITSEFIFLMPIFEALPKISFYPRSKSVKILENTKSQHGMNDYPSNNWRNYRNSPMFTIPFSQVKIKVFLPAHVFPRRTTRTLSFLS